MYDFICISYINDDQHTRLPCFLKSYKPSTDHVNEEMLSTLESRQKYLSSVHYYLGIFNKNKFNEQI